MGYGGTSAALGAAALIAFGCSSADDGSNGNEFEGAGGGLGADGAQAPGTGGGYVPPAQGGSYGAGGTVSPGTGGSALPPVTCGNGVVDSGEDCDGLPQISCAQASMGALTSGVVNCTGCRFDLTQCFSSSPGAGGGLGTGGMGNAAGGSPPSGGGSGGGGPIGGDTPTNLPTAKEACQAFRTGDMTFSGSRVKIWAGAPAHGPLVFYWYATGSSVAEVTRGLGQAAIDEITSQGGVVAAMYQTTRTGDNTGNGVWYTGDFDVADQIVACAIEQQHIDTRRIHALGFSAGGLQSGIMAFVRSNYVASVVTYSGGSLSQTLADPNAVPSVMCQHGDQGSDVVIIDFAQASQALETAIKSKGGFAMDCHHPGGHLIPAGDVPASWHFLKDHPFKVNPKPYAGGIPAGFPTYCTIP